MNVIEATGMNIGEAMAVVKSGRVVSRATWAPGIRVGFAHGGVYQRQVEGFHVSWSPTADDLFAQDWRTGENWPPINTENAG